MLKLEKYLDWSLPPELSFTNREFDVTVKDGMIHISVDLQGYDSRLSADASIPLAQFLEAVRELQDVEQARLSRRISNV
jgi:hypothetical protein